jgi:hypothetical protein
MQKWITTLCVTFFLLQNGLVSQTINATSLDYKVLDSIKGAILYKKNVKTREGEWSILLQVIDIQQVKVEHLASTPHEGNQPEGLYLADKKFSKSPYFKMYGYQNAIKQAEKKYSKNLWGLMNAAFFEQYGDSTQLAFPIKVNGIIQSSGSSPNGPQNAPKIAYYKNTTLKALVWNDTMVSIQNYNPKTGHPLTDNSVKNALVSYDYKDHPAIILRKDPANRYHVLGTIKNQLLILTVNQTSLEYAAQHLRTLGVKGFIMTIDGGVSVFIHNHKKGNLELPSNTEKKLPHYFAFVKK